MIVRAWTAIIPVLEKFRSANFESAFWKYFQLCSCVAQYPTNDSFDKLTRQPIARMAFRRAYQAGSLSNDMVYEACW